MKLHCLEIFVNTDECLKGLRNGDSKKLPINIQCAQDKDKQHGNLGNRKSYTDIEKSQKCRLPYLEKTEI